MDKSDLFKPLEGDKHYLVTTKNEIEFNSLLGYLESLSNITIENKIPEYINFEKIRGTIIHETRVVIAASGSLVSDMVNGKATVRDNYVLVNWNTLQINMNSIEDNLNKLEEKFK